DYQTAHEIGRQLADAVTKGQHEYVLTTYIDKGHIHNHIIFCAVNFVDHHKYVSNKRTYYGIRNMSD
ncbi:relaxase/mobilization nuclease domain-containing protein, partial [Xanthomonas citri pv. citri]|nr:relaxase/mobilization nuclease domain-containing protein [Xanthomonas citri pv. citri]